MGCCCPKEKPDEEGDERQRLLGNDHAQKSRFVDSNGVASGSAQTNQPRSGGPNGTANGLLNDPNGLLDSQFANGGGSSLNGGGGTSGMPNGANANAAQSAHNQVFDKILSEVIRVSPFEQRANNVGMVGGNGGNGGDMMINQVQEMPFKLRGLLEPQLNKQQFTLPDGVPAPLGVLSAQPPFLNDIRLINSVALEANNCVNNYSLNVPDNVAFDFRPVGL